MSGTRAKGLAGQFAMSTQNKKFVLAVESQVNGICKAALSIAGENGSVLIARTVESALEFARVYKPTHAVISQTQTMHNDQFLPALLLEFSPVTEIVILGGEASETENCYRVSAVG
jgi:hypothetical protein